MKQKKTVTVTNCFYFLTRKKPSMQLKRNEIWIKQMNNNVWISTYFNFNTLNLKSLYKSKRYDSTLSQSYKKSSTLRTTCLQSPHSNWACTYKWKIQPLPFIFKETPWGRGSKTGPKIQTCIFFVVRRGSLCAAGHLVSLGKFTRCSSPPLSKHKCQKWHKQYHQSHQYGNWKLNSVPCSFRES